MSWWGVLGVFLVIVIYGAVTTYVSITLLTNGDGNREGAEQDSEHPLQHGH
jgi:hypothetical protein